MKFKQFCLQFIISFLGFYGIADACSPVHLLYRYNLRDGAILYERLLNPDSSSSETETLNILTGLDKKSFHCLASDSRNSSKNLLDDGMHFNQDANYFSDGKQVVWFGKILKNMDGAPAVHAASFVQPFWGDSFAADSSSLYYQGTRTEENPGRQPIDIKKIKRLDEYLLSDGRYLYHNGHRIGLADGYQVIKMIRYGDGAACRQGEHLLVRTVDSIFVDGNKIVADADSFSLKRWIPEELMDYQDKNGLHTFTYGRDLKETEQRLQDNQSRYPGFVAGRKTVYYTKSYDSSAYKWKLIELSGVDPETFSQLNERVGTDGKQLYVLNGNLEALEPLELEIIPLDSADIELHTPVTVGKDYLYFINRGGVQRYQMSGAFVVLSDYFAHDEKYVYVFSEGYADTPAVRFPTSSPELVELEDRNYAYSELLTVEGRYTTDGQFMPMNMLALKYLSNNDYSMDDKYVYFKNQKIDGADPESFHLVDYSLGVDRNHCYYYGRQLDEADPATIKPIKGGYSRDSKSIFFESEKINGADIATFVILPIGDRWAHDAKHVYYGSKTLPYADPNSFLQLDYLYAKDAKQVFYKDQPLVGADVSSFKVVGEKAFDKKQIYKNGHIQ